MTQSRKKNETPRAGTMGQRIYDLRKRRGLKQSDLAEMAGVHQGTISDLENAPAQNVRAFQLFALAAALDVTPEYLLKGDNAGRLKKGEITPDEQDLLADFRRLSREERLMVIRFIRALALDK